MRIQDNTHKTRDGIMAFYVYKLAPQIAPAVQSRFPFR